MADENIIKFQDYPVFMNTLSQTNTGSRFAFNFFEENLNKFGPM